MKLSKRHLQSPQKEPTSYWKVEATLEECGTCISMTRSRLVKLHMVNESLVVLRIQYEPNPSLSGEEIRIRAFS